jgi:superfamily II DNA or RNA helicase
MNAVETFAPGSLVTLRGRDWIVQPSESPEELLVVKPLGGSDDETTGIFLPLGFDEDLPQKAEFPKPTSADLGNIANARLLYEAARLSFRNGSGPFRCLAKLSFRPRAYQIVPLVMALRQDVTRLLIADDVGIGKTIEALLIVKELLERRVIKRFAIVCLPHLCDQWQQEIREKIGMDAVVIRSSTQARLDREIVGDTSVYQYYPFQIISIDYIKSDSRRQVFIQEAPELVVVDEVHTCACPQGATVNQQQRHALIKDLSRRADRHLILLTATPHSGKNEEFQSLLGLLSSEFEKIELLHADPKLRRDLAKYYIQRRRGDVSKWMDGDTPFPVREPAELNYNLTTSYAAFFADLYDFARKLITGDLNDRARRVHYWTALGLLRGVMSSPAAGIYMLRNRQTRIQEAEQAVMELPSNPLGDAGESESNDAIPEELFAAHPWSESQKNTLRSLERSLTSIVTANQDQKIQTAAKTIKTWIEKGFNPVIFCQYIPTANYVGEQLAKLLPKKVNVQVVTSEDPDEVRRERIDAMKATEQRVLVATDCLSEGINLHELFTAVLHYDLPWNPNRLEQREGRVDRFGQTADVVKAVLLYSKDNPVDGVVLNVILRKVQAIKKSTGATVAFPGESQSVIDTITQSLLLNDAYRPAKDNSQEEFSFVEEARTKELDGEITDQFHRAEELAKATRSIFAQHSIKAQDIEQDLKDTDEAIGNPKAVETFIVLTLRGLMGVQIDPIKIGTHDIYHLYTENLPASLQSLLPEGTKLNISFHSPTPAKVIYLGRNHPFVEQLCQLVLAGSLNRDVLSASRASALRSSSVQKPTTVLLFRVRNVIEEKKAETQLVAEEMLIWGYRGAPEENDFLSPTEARELLLSAKPAGDELALERRQRLITDAADSTDKLESQFEGLAEDRCKQLVEAHERFCELVDKRRYQVVYPVLPMDILGIYVLLPA